MDGARDMIFNIRFGKPFPVRIFPDTEAAKAYVLSGLDRARDLLRRAGGGHGLLHHVANRVRDVRLHVAADQIPAAMAASAELRALAPEAERMRVEASRLVRRHRFARLLSGLACIIVGGTVIAPFGPVPTQATVALYMTLAVVVPYVGMRLAFGAICLVAPFVHATTTAGLLLLMAWRLWLIAAGEEVERLTEGERVAVEIERMVAAVDEILNRLIN